MKLYERTRLLLEPFLQSHYYFVRKQLEDIAFGVEKRMTILDVGGRESPYTLGISADIILSELPREDAVQHDLNLGITDSMQKKLERQRSNIKEIVIDDMTTSNFQDEMFDCVVAVEVLEHVEEDSLFLDEVFRVLKPGGAFVMTTPNGDFIPNTNPDHKRHYQRSELLTLLDARFSNVEVIYRVQTGTLLSLGWIKRFSFKRPIRTLAGGVANALNLLRSIGDANKYNRTGHAHLFATAIKPE